MHPRENDKSPASATGGAALDMMLRDYFAAKAMQTLIASVPHYGSSDQRLAGIAYGLADAMLAERAKS